jgi:uncharacterized protein
MMRPIIVGIDPGTTVGYAILDLSGDIIEIRSAKNLDIAHLIHIISEKGLPVLIGTDRGKAPGAVATIATKLGGRLITSKRDLLVDEKRQLCRDTHTGNDHERDALAAALICYQRVQPLIGRIDRFIDEHQAQDIGTELKRLVLGSEMSIKAAAALLSTHAPEQKKALLNILHQRDTKADYLRLYEGFDRLRREHDLIRAQRDHFASELDRIRKKPRVQILDKKLERVVHQKEQTIQTMITQIQHLKRQLAESERARQQLSHLLLDFGRYRIIKVLDHLGTAGFSQKKETLNIRDHDVIYVRSVSIVSPKVLAELRAIDAFIVENPNAMLKDFPLINPKDLNMTFHGEFAVADRSSVERALDRSSVLRRVIHEYKKEVR